MEQTIQTQKPTALLLGGGGAKGAFQIGAWQALAEAGLTTDITAVAGCSVGALNAALFAIGDPAYAKRVWEQILPSDLLARGSDGAFFSRDGLIRMINQLPLEQVSTSKIQTYVSVHDVADDTAVFFKLNGLSADAIRTLLLASSAIPHIYSPERYLGREFLDGSVTPEGDLYIAVNQGVAKVNINMPIEEVSSLKITIPYLEADGDRIYPGADGAYHVLHQVHKLTVYSYVFNYSLSDPTVSYRMEGFDRRPTTVSRKDLAPVVYTNLPGGTYRFVMNVQDSLKHTSKPYSVQIIKEKAFYEQTVFYIASALATLLLLSAGIRWYVRRKTRMMEIKNRKAVEEERLNTELKMASQIQGSVLPHDFPPFPDRTEFDIYASMDPAREVGGDFYDYFLIDDDHLGLVIADVSGKGIPASLFMMISKVIVQSCAMLGQGPANILSKTNEAICSNNQVDMFVTVWVGILEISTGRLTAANAGHEYPALMKNGVFSMLKDKHSFVIGGMENVPYREYELFLEPGDKLFLYTDGLPEATDANGKMFGKERILQVLNEKASASPRAILNHVTGAVNEFVRDAEQFDDLTMLCLEYKGPQGLPQEKREVSSRPVGDPGTEPR